MINSFTTYFIFLQQFKWERMFIQDDLVLQNFTDNIV